MDIITFSESLLLRIKKTEIPMAGQHDSTRRGKALANIRDIIRELKKFTVQYAFLDAREEIKFFKELKPVIVSQYIFYKKVFSIGLFDSFNTHEKRLENYHLVLQDLQQYVFRHRTFYEYCMAGSTYLDHQYFVRNKINLQEPDKDEKFTTGFDYTLSKILAHELVRQYVTDSIRKLQVEKPGQDLLPWTASKVALTELAYALHASGVFNHGQADIKQIVAGLEQVFSIDLGNYPSTFSDIRLRKKGRTVFIDSLKERLTQVMEDLD